MNQKEHQTTQHRTQFVCINNTYIHAYLYQYLCLHHLIYIYIYIYKGWSRCLQLQRLLPIHERTLRDDDQDVSLERGLASDEGGQHILRLYLLLSTLRTHPLLYPCESCDLLCVFHDAEKKGRKQTPAVAEFGTAESKQTQRPSLFARSTHATRENGSCRPRRRWRWGRRSLCQIRGLCLIGKETLSQRNEHRRDDEIETILHARLWLDEILHAGLWLDEILHVGGMISVMRPSWGFHDYVYMYKYLYIRT